LAKNSNVAAPLKGLAQNNHFSSGHIVTPAKAGVQEISKSLDSGFRRNDGRDFPQGGWLQEM
jgi:hypothetical protein